MGSMSVSSSRYCMFVSCVHSVAVLNSAFCMTWLLKIKGITIDDLQEIGKSIDLQCAVDETLII